MHQNSLIEENNELLTVINEMSSNKELSFDTDDQIDYESELPRKYSELTLIAESSIINDSGPARSLLISVSKTSTFN